MRRLILQARGITRVFRVNGHEVHAIRGVDLAVPEGEFAAILGPSGAGKSTLLGILAFRDSPTAGDLFYRGRLVSGLDEAERELLRLNGVGLVPPAPPGRPPEEEERRAIGQSLASRPAVLLVDEPTGRLDSQAGARIMGLLSDLHRSGLSVLLTTDDPEVAACCPTLYRMRDGILTRISG